MNERIRQLAIEAGFYANPDVEKFEKFAELIVRECIGACLQDDWEDPRWGRFYANKIKEYFGVE